MKFIFTGKNVDITKSLTDYSEKKIGKVEKLLQGDSVAYIVFETKKDKQKVEVTIKTSYTTLRAEEEHESMYAAIDNIEVVLDRQLRKYKTKIDKQRKDGERAYQVEQDKFDGFDNDDDNDEISIVKTKKFGVKPMFADEACLEMELLGHNFFVFLNAETEEVNVVYKRKDGKYGLIEPELQ